MTAPAREEAAEALTAARAAIEKQAEGVLVMDLRGLSAITDYFVVCTAGSARQLDALKDHIEAVLARSGVRLRHAEGTAPPADAARAFGERLQWVLMDFGDVVVHLMDQPTRSFYRLEDLWADAPRIPVEPAGPHPA